MRSIPICAHDGPIVLCPETDRAWRFAYRAHRYMRDMPEPALQQRRRDIFRNFMTINALGKACPLPADHRLHGFWRLRFVHVLEEFSLRFGHSPGGMDSDLALGVYFPNPHSKRLLAGRAAVAGRVFEDGRYLFKFGKRHHLESMLHGGELRIAPASSYSDASFNNAVRDNELDREFWIHDPTNEDLRPYSHGRTARIPSKGSAIWVRSSEDYWLYCLSATYDPAMYDDFDCNACLVISA